MKTIAFNRSRGTLFTTALVVSGLAALYVYRRTGGRFVVPLVEAAAGLIATRIGKSTAGGGVDKEATESVDEPVGGALEKTASAAKTRKLRRSSRASVDANLG